MNPEEIKLTLLKKLLTEKKISQEDFNKISYRSYHTDNLCYVGVRIGNSIGDQIENGIKLKILELVANKFSIPFNSIDHGEIHSRSIDENAVIELINAIKLFESLVDDKKFITDLVNKTNKSIVKEFNKH